MWFAVFSKIFILFWGVLLKVDIIGLMVVFWNIFVNILKRNYVQLCNNGESNSWHRVGQRGLWNSGGKYFSFQKGAKCVAHRNGYGYFSHKEVSHNQANFHSQDVWTLSRSPEQVAKPFLGCRGRLFPGNISLTLLRINLKCCSENMQICPGIETPSSLLI